MREDSLPSETPGNDGGGGLNIMEKVVMVTHDLLLSWSRAIIFCEHVHGTCHLILPKILKKECDRPIPAVIDGGSKEVRELNSLPRLCC